MQLDVFTLVPHAFAWLTEQRPLAAVLGTVADVLPGVANDVLQLDSGLSLPMVEDCIRAVDLAEGRILIAPGFVMPS